jgi:hypothetical protein
MGEIMGFMAYSLLVVTCNYVDSVSNTNAVSLTSCYHKT